MIILSFIVNQLLKLLSYPIELLALFIVWFRKKEYDPEKRPCPGCGYKGEKNSNYKSCIISFVQVADHRLGAIRHTCLRCSAPYYSDLLVEGKAWIASGQADKIAQVRELIKRKAI